MDATIAEIKAYLLVEHSEDDALLTSLYQACKGMVEGFLDLKIVTENPTTGQIAMTDQIDTAILSGVAFIYENRGDSKNSLNEAKSDVLPIIRMMLMNKRSF